MPLVASTAHGAPAANDVLSFQPSGRADPGGPAPAPRADPHRRRVGSARTHANRRPRSVGGVSQRAAAQAGRRCVRIIHGKGYRSGARGPVLKIAVDLWLRRHHDVMAFTSARAHRRRHRRRVCVAARLSVPQLLLARLQLRRRPEFADLPQHDVANCPRPSMKLSVSDPGLGLHRRVRAPGIATSAVPASDPAAEQIRRDLLDICRDSRVPVRAWRPASADRPAPQRSRTDECRTPSSAAAGSSFISVT